MRTDLHGDADGSGMCLPGLLAAGCSSDLKPTNAKLEKGLNAYFENHNECLFPAGLKFPYEVSPGVDAKGEKTHMDAMRKARDCSKQEDDLGCMWNGTR